MNFILGNFVTYERGIDLSDCFKPRKEVTKRPIKGVWREEISDAALGNPKFRGHNLKSRDAWHNKATHAMSALVTKHTSAGEATNIPVSPQSLPLPAKWSQNQDGGMPSNCSDN